MSHLYILKINPLSLALFAIIFCHSGGCLFILFIVSFAVQRILYLIGSHFFIFSVSITLGSGSEDLAEIYVTECSANVFP